MFDIISMGGSLEYPTATTLCESEGNKLRTEYYPAVQRFRPTRFAFRGFSLVEVSIVVVIVGILTVFAMEYYSGSLNDIKASRTKLLMEQVRDACKRYALDYGRYPSEIKEMIPKYLKENPRSPWNTPILLKFGDVNEVSCTFPWGEEKRTINVKLDNLGFGKDNRTDVSALAKQAMSFYKTNSYRPTGEVDIFNVDLEMQVKTLITDYSIELGSDFRFFVTDADVVEVTSDYLGSIEILPFNGSPSKGFDYSSKASFDTIRIKLANCRRLTSFTVNLFRPLEAGVVFYYGERKILELANPISPPITITRLISETTRYIK